MPVKASQNFIRSFRLTVFVENGDSEPRAEDIVIKHRPVSDEWLEKWAEITAQEERELGEEIDRLTKDYQDEVARLAKESEDAKKHDREFDETAAKERLSKKLGDAQERLKEKKQKSLLVRQLADILIDIDHVDDDGNRIPPTEEFLHTRDKALLVEIQTNIEKKLFPERTNGRR